MKCFNCEEDGHMAWQCGTIAATTPERPDALAMYRRPPAEISQRYTEWADKIRAEMGWAKGQARNSRGKSWAEIAAEQVAESHAARLAPGHRPVDISGVVSVTPSATPPHALQ